MQKLKLAVSLGIIPSTVSDDCYSVTMTFLCWWEHLMPGNFEITIEGLATMMLFNFASVCQAYQFSNEAAIKAFCLIKASELEFSRK